MFSQSLSHFFLHVNGLPHTTQIFCGKLAFDGFFSTLPFPRRPNKTVLLDEYGLVVVCEFVLTTKAASELMLVAVSASRATVQRTAHRLCDGTENDKRCILSFLIL